MGAVITLTTDFGMADAYVAARLSLGFPPADFGEAVTSVTMLPLPQPYRASDSSLVGQVMKDTRGRANPKLVNELLKSKLEEV